MTSLTIAEAVPLGAALAVRVARNANIRALVIKGPALEHQGLRGKHESVDVDLMVFPPDHLKYLAVLAECGWTPIPRVSSLDLLSHHATTVHHPSWPITLDVHNHFPGLLASPTQAFNALWAARDTIVTAGVHLDVPSPAAHAVVAAVHYMRTPTSGLALLALPDLVSRVRLILSEGDLETLVQVAASTGTTDVLHDFLTQVGAPTPCGSGPHDPDSVRVWAEHQSNVRGARWLAHLAAQPWNRRPAALWQILGLTQSDIDLVRGPDESRSLARLRRVRAGFSALPAAVHQVTRQRRQHPGRER